MSSRICKPYTTDDLRTILQMGAENKSYSEIAKATGRTIGAITTFFYNERKTGCHSSTINYLAKKDEKKVDIMVGGVKVAEAPRSMVSTKDSPETPVAKTVEMSPREMIKKLYNLGYRIENNQLVCYVKQTVRLQDIINGE